MQLSQKLQLLVWCAMKVSFYTTLYTENHSNVQCESKKIPPEIFWHFFPNGWKKMSENLGGIFLTHTVDIANLANACADMDESRGLILPKDTLMEALLLVLRCGTSVISKIFITFLHSKSINP